MKHVHFIGIGGSGLSAIALLLLESGVRVSGSDRALSPLAQSLQAAGAQVTIGHQPGNIDGASLVIRSSAIPDENVEVQAARAAGIPVLKRSDFLPRLMAGRQGIAVAGTHGKTTTTAMIAWILTALGYDPSFIIGGVSANLGANAHAGQGPHFVIEADEYDRMFLGLRPVLAVVTNLEHDHPDCYPTAEDFYQAFLSFTRCISPGGSLLACLDDPGAARLLQETAGAGLQSFSYGIENDRADYQATGLKPVPSRGLAFEIHRRATGRLASVALQVPGEHNVRNASAALAVADRLGLPSAEAAQALGEYRGTGRRFELLGEAAGIALISDYAHHPTEIRATLAAARERYPGRRIWAVWQPHTYSRTRLLFSGFASAFKDAGRVVVVEIYPAREAPPADGFSARHVVEAMDHPGAAYLPELSSASDYILDQLRPGDVVIVLSAGDADQIGAQVLHALQLRDHTTT